MPRIYDVLGVPIHATDLAGAVTVVQSLGRTSRSPGMASYVCVRDVNGIVECQRSPRLRAIHQQAAMITADGMPVVWWGRAHGYSEARRVYGPDLMHETCRTSPALGIRHYLCGGNEGVAEALRARLLQTYPGLDIVGVFTPPFRPLSDDEYVDLAAKIEASGAEVIWIGMSSPKQEMFMSEMSVYLRTGVLIGVGAAFDFLSGRKRQAPRWVQRSGFEWLFRLASEPRRLWRRYLINNSVFLALTVRYMATVILGRFRLTHSRKLR